MRISEKFNLEKTQAELDFVDIDLSTDMPLFLDPFFLSKRKDKWSIDASRTIKSFFQHLIDLIRTDNLRAAEEMFEFLTEPNATCLGLSRGNPRGKGVGVIDTTKIFKNLLKSKAIHTGLLNDLEDNILFVENFGKDKLSDMTTNIIRSHLIEYTQNQCNLHNIRLTGEVPSDYFWKIDIKGWDNVYTKMLIIDSKKIILVPKGIVSYCKSYTPLKYYNNFVLNFLQNENLRLKTSLVQKRKSGLPYVTKKSLKEDSPYSKSFLRDFTRKHPEILQKFKNETYLAPLSNLDINDSNAKSIVPHLLSKLQSIPPGKDHANSYHKLIIGILEFLFYPNLINPIKELEIHEGRKRIDITFDNSSYSGIFHRLPNIFNIPCPYIFIECKNYSTDIKNPELDQLSGRFSTNRGKVGFIIYRSITDENSIIKRCIDTYKDGRGLIIPLCDLDLNTLLENFNEYDDTFLNNYITELIRKITVV